jgi:hypothetical protein
MGHFLGFARNDTLPANQPHTHELHGIERHLNGQPVGKPADHSGHNWHGQKCYINQDNPQCMNGGHSTEGAPLIVRRSYYPPFDSDYVTDDDLNETDRHWPRRQQGYGIAARQELTDISPHTKEAGNCRLPKTL